MAKLAITLNVPEDLLERLKDKRIQNPLEFLETFFDEVDVTDMLALLEDDDDDFWYDDDEDF